jgi:hypothetical protein
MLNVYHAVVKDHNGNAHKLGIGDKFVLSCHGCEDTPFEIKAIIKDGPKVFLEYIDGGTERRVRAHNARAVAN